MNLQQYVKTFLLKGDRCAEESAGILYKMRRLRDIYPAHYDRRIPVRLKKDNKYSELNTQRKRKRSIRGYILQQRLNFRFFITGHSGKCRRPGALLTPVPARLFCTFCTSCTEVLFAFLKSANVGRAGEVYCGERNWMISAPAVRISML